MTIFWAVGGDSCFENLLPKSFLKYFFVGWSEVFVFAFVFGIKSTTYNWLTMGIDVQEAGEVANKLLVGINRSAKQL